jgi:glutamate N-acetyltransferase/amino-acid N-acetyltransferase
MKNDLSPETVNVPGFKACALFCGIKKQNKDLTLITCEKGAVAAAVFTTNLSKAAPVIVSQENMKQPLIHAVVINSGNANACNGERGLNDAKRTAAKAGALLGVDPASIIVSSTGVIGVPLPVEKLEAGLEEAVPMLKTDGLAEAAEGIMTTDTFRKLSAKSVTLPESGVTVQIVGFSKGSGMIHPNMATMLGFTLTDANIEKDVFQNLQKESTDVTFNMISVDGDTSTNDMSLALSSCEAGNPPLKPGTKDYEVFKDAFIDLQKTLAKLIAKDGEGASKLIQVKINGARTEKDARLLARSVTTSSLVKAAIFGRDANWGRVLCAMGYAGGMFNPDLVDLYFESEFGSIQLMEKGAGLIFDEDKALKILESSTIDIVAQLHEGDASAEAWGCDLTYEYVKINGEYRS